MVQLLRNGCAYMRRAFDIEAMNLDELISTALDRLEVPPGTSRRFTASISPT